MNRSVFAPALALLITAAVTTSAFAQAQNAAPTTPAAPARAKFATPVKGTATIEVVRGASKFEGKEIVTVYKVRNTSAAPIAMLKIDEYWYDDKGKMVSSDTRRWKQPFPPGEIIEMTTRAPATPGAKRNQGQFSHANGEIKATPVKQFK
jgi:hypothetical protein